MRQLTTEQTAAVSGGVSASTIIGITELVVGCATADPILIVLGAGDLAVGQMEK
jgi:hypothetical protein